MTKARTYRYSAYTAASDGATHTHVGTLTGAIRKARKYARETYPAWTYHGYGPTVVVADETGRRVYEVRL